MRIESGERANARCARKGANGGNLSRQYRAKPAREGVTTIHKEYIARAIRVVEAPDFLHGRRYGLFRLVTGGSKGDYDSDTILITDHPKLIEIAKRHDGEFLVPTNMISSEKIKRHFTSEDKADLDIKTSVNKIGEIKTSLGAQRCA